MVIDCNIVSLEIEVRFVIQGTGGRFNRERLSFQKYSSFIMCSSEFLGQVRI
jgi:hypothetical protein